MLSFSPGETLLSVIDFANVRETGDAVTYNTHYLDFSGMEQAVKGYWFSRLVIVDASLISRSCHSLKS